jgi:hypothetical protein
MNKDESYLARRIEQEKRIVARASSPVSRAAHQTLLDLYRSRLQPPTQPSG